MTTVQLPDGKIVQFPDGMSNADINAALASQQGDGTSVSAAPPQYTGIGRPLIMAGQALGQGLAEAAGLPGDLQAGLSHLTGLPKWAPLGIPGPPLPTSDELVAGAAKLGLAPTDTEVPQNEFERDLSGAARGIGTAVPALLAGPAEVAAPMLAASGFGGLTQAEAVQAHGAGVGADLAGAAAGAAVGNLTGGGIRAARALSGDLTDAGKLFEAAGLPMRSAALTSNKPSSSLLPFAPVEATHGDISRGLSSLANSLGSSVTKTDAGNYAQAHAHDWLTTTLPAKEALAWGPVDRALPATTQTPITNLMTTLKTMTGKGGQLSDAVQTLQPGLPAQLQKVLQTRFNSILGKGGNPTPSWQDVRSLRSAIGQAMSEPSIAPKAGAQNLSALYSAVTKDLGATAQQHGAGDLFSVANAESSRLHEFAEGTLSKIIGGKTAGAADSPKPEDVVANLLASGKLKKGGTDIERLNTELPDVTRELAATQLHELANPTAVNQTVGGNLAKHMAQISPEAAKALYPPAVLAKLEPMAQIGGKLAGMGQGAASNEVNTGLLASLGTGGALAAGGLAHLMGHDLPVRDLLELGGGATTAGALLGAVKNKATQKLANSPTLAKLASGRPVDYLLPWQVTGQAGLASGGNELEGEKKGTGKQ